MSALYYRIEKLCKSNGMTITSMCKESGASRASLSDLKVGRKQGLSTETLSKIARVLGCSVGLLIGEKPEWEDAIDEFGFCWDATFREEKKAGARAIVSDPTSSVEDRIAAQIVVFKSLFSRSLESSGYDLEHPDFNSYVAMLLWQGPGLHGIPRDIYDLLISRYGTQPGMPQGTHYAIQNKTTPTLTEKDERDIAKDLERIMAQLDSSGDLMFDGDPMSDEARESMLSAMRLGLQAAKLKNKERFTPKKYKKG